MGGWGCQLLTADCCLPMRRCRLILNDDDEDEDEDEDEDDGEDEDDDDNDDNND